MTRIDRCVCTGRLFAELIETARAGGMSAEQVALSSGASACCGMCRPYLRRACRTGQTVFDELLTDADEPCADAAADAP